MTGSATRFTRPSGSGFDRHERHSMTRPTRTGFCLVLILGCLTSPLVAQSRTDVRGIVTDETGGLIVGASVTLTDARGGKTTTSTNNEGRYRLAADTRGKMTLSIEAAGFAPEHRTITFSGSTTIDVKLRVAINERVDV